MAFVAGSFAAVLLLASVLDPDLFLHFEITPHRTVLYYLSIFGSILAVARGMVPDKNRVFNPERLMREVVLYTHYMPAEWKGKLHSQAVGHLLECIKISIHLVSTVTQRVWPAFCHEDHYLWTGAIIRSIDSFHTLVHTSRVCSCHSGFFPRIHGSRGRLRPCVLVCSLQL